MNEETRIKSVGVGVKERGGNAVVYVDAEATAIWMRVWTNIYI
jgi:hypothetical protein